ncbi:MAG TPA: enoyl-CoA hydratase-related protein [Ilumatobacteraceae bacterium]|nr:enoyl-CoA hydratase-related protein [Ilumatobacteraceae bacterium]
MDPIVRFARDGEIARITLDSQANRNALSQRLLDELHQALDRSVGARVIVLGHAGPAFCAGADLRERAAGLNDSTELVRAIERIEQADAPVIAAIDGAVRAGGMGLVAACDLVVASKRSTFACPEVRIGVAPAIVAVGLIARCGWTALAGPLLTGDVFDAAHAHSIGLVTETASDADDVARRVDALCASIGHAAPGAVAATKSLLHRPQLMADAQRLSEQLFASDEAAEGMRAFLEKREPNWSGNER